MILLDTNIISELWRVQPSRLVEQWIDAQPEITLFISAMTLGELHYGAMRMPEGKRKLIYLESIATLERQKFESRVLGFDRSCSAAFGQIMALREKMGRPVVVADAVIGAIAKTHNLTLATRNTRDFDDLGLQLINPFEPQS